MEDLPPELLAHVMECCDHDARQNLRLVNHLFDELATPFVFKHLYLAMQCEPMLKLGSVVKNDKSVHDLAKHVKAITLYGDALPCYDTREQYARVAYIKKDFREWLEEEGRSCQPGDWQDWLDNFPGSALSSQQVDAGWKAYKKLQDEQNVWTIGNEGSCFAKLLASLPNLIEANVTCAQHGKTDEARRWPSFRHLRSPVYLCPSYWMSVQNVEDDGLRGTTAATTLTLLEGIVARNSGPKAATCRPITKLQLRPNCQSSYQSLRRTLYDNSAPLYDLGRISSAFRDLTDVCIEMFEFHAHDTWSESLDELTTFLKSSQRLRRLRLSLEGQHVPREQYPRPHQIEDLFSSESVIWPSIESVSIKARASTPSILSFLELHNQTLHELDLRRLDVGNVQLFLERLPKVVLLKKVYLENLQGPVRDPSVDDPVWGMYLLRTGCRSSVRARPESILTQTDY